MSHCCVTGLEDDCFWPGPGVTEVSTRVRAAVFAFFLLRIIQIETEGHDSKYFGAELRLNSGHASLG